MNATALVSLPSAAALGLAEVRHLTVTSSTMDDAHAAGVRGASAGTLIVADVQVQGRGRSGRSWHSSDGAGLWMTLLERPADTDAPSVLALRVGLALAEALAPFVSSPIALKWPNDLYVAEGKLAGILIEARWRQAQVDWVAIGVGVNLRVPADVPTAASVHAGTTRHALLHAIIPRMRDAAAQCGTLTERELAAWYARDVAVGRRISAPVAGIVVGIAADGALVVRPDARRREEVAAGTHDDAAVGRADCDLVHVHAGSMIFSDSEV